MFARLTLLLTFTTSSISLLGDSIRLKSHEQLQGKLIEIQAGFVLLQLEDAEGEAIRRISPNTIESLTFTDTDATLEHQALTRSKFLPLLSESDAKILTHYLLHLQSTQQNGVALNHTKFWHPKNNYPSLDPIYRTLLIENSLAAGLPSEALIHAQNWLAQDPQPFSHPLPWQILAKNQLDSGNPEAALWTALTPIAHASQQNQASLDSLYKLAAQAYQELGYPEHSQAYLSHQPIPMPTLALSLDPTP